jgi:acyl carrier protein
MTVQDATPDSAFRQRVVGAMSTVLAELLKRSEPITEDMRLMEELGLSSTLALELLLALEEQLEVLIDVEQMGQSDTATVGAMATFIAGHSQPA